MRTSKAALLFLLPLAALPSTSGAEPLFRLLDQQLPAETERFDVPLVVTQETGILGFQLYGRYDPAILRLADVSVEGTALESKEFLSFKSLEPPFSISVLPPLSGSDGDLIPPGAEQVCLRLLFEVVAGAPIPTTTIVSLDRNAPEFLENGVFIENTLVLAALNDATITIGAHPERVFLRGDADGNGVVEISDPIRTLSYLFLGAEVPPCLDAADVFDRGVIDISAPVATLSFLFNGGPPPAAPFPEPGIDPTPDSLECP